MASAAGLIGESCKRDFVHDFGLGLPWEKESDEGNAFRGLERGARDRGRRMAMRRGTVATASKRCSGKGRGRRKAGL
jgi:hypothetical protein